MNTLYINGSKVPETDIKDLSDIEIEYSSNADKVASNAPDVEITGDTARWLLENVVDTRSQTPAEIRRTCCNNERVIFKGVLTWRTVEWCNGVCKVRARITSDSKEDAAYECIRKALVMANKPFGNTTFHKAKHPYVRYCDDPRPAGVRYLIISLGLLLLFSMAMLLPIYLFVGAIYSAIKAVVTLDANSAFEGMKEWYNNLFVLMNNILAALSGCGRGHPAPFVRDMLTNACNQCGLTLSTDTPFTNPQSPYLNTVWFQAQIQEGRANADNKAYMKYFDLNAPNISSGELLDSVSGLMNHRWWVENDTLYFKYSDFPNTVFFDAILNPESVESLCFEADSENVPAVEEFVYATDGVDTVGDEARYLYNDIIDYSNPPDAGLSGIKSNEFLFGASRFRGDGISPDVLDAYNPLIQTLGSVLNALDFNPVDVIQTDIDNVLLLEKGKCQNPKLLILKGNYDNTNAKVVKNGETYNGPWMFDFETYDSIRYANPPESEKRRVTPNLAQFWLSNDPINSLRKGFEYTLILKSSCQLYNDLMNLIETNGVNVSVRFEFRGKTVVANVNRIKLSGINLEITGKI